MRRVGCGVRLFDQKVQAQRVHDEHHNLVERGRRRLVLEVSVHKWLVGGADERDSHPCQQEPSAEEQQPEKLQRAQKPDHIGHAPRAHAQRHDVAHVALVLANRKGAALRSSRVSWAEAERSFSS